MKLIFAIVVLFFSQGLFSQNSYDEQYELELSDCFMSKPESKDLRNHINECMVGFDFQYFCVTDIYGKEHCSSDFKGYHLLNYWFEACPPCKIEKPYLEKLTAQFPNLPIISLSRDAKESFNDIIKKELDWICVPSYADKGINNNRYGFPLTMLLDNKGSIALFYLGGIVTDSKFDRIRSFLNNH